QVLTQTRQQTSIQPPPEGAPIDARRSEGFRALNEVDRAKVARRLDVARPFFEAAMRLPEWGRADVQSQADVLRHLAEPPELNARTPSRTALRERLSHSEGWSALTPLVQKQLCDRLEDAAFRRRATASLNDPRQRLRRGADAAQGLQDLL